MFNNAIVLPNAEMGQEKYQNKFGIETTQISFPGQINIDNIQESLEVITATHSLTKKNWLKMQVYAWMTNFIYYKHCLLQPLCLFLYYEYQISFRKQIEWFCNTEYLKFYPLLTKVQSTLFQSAETLQLGIYRKEENKFLDAIQDGVQLNPELILQTEINKSNSWPQFFKEVSHLIQSRLITLEIDVPKQLYLDIHKLTQANFYNHFYGKQTIYRSEETNLKESRIYLSYSLDQYYQDCLQGMIPELNKKAIQYLYFGPKV